MPTYAVFPIDPPVSGSHLAAYKALRLAALQGDPHAFTSTHAHEAAFPEDVWRQRLDSPSKRTLVAAVRGRTDVDGEAEDPEWIGTASIIGPSDMMASPSVVGPFREAGVGSNWEIYGLYAMWVHPAHRGKGVGAQLVKSCLEWARTHVDAKFSGGNGGNFEKLVVLLVYDNNVAGRALYSRMGFTDLPEVSAKEGERWMVTKV